MEDTLGFTLLGFWDEEMQIYLHCSRCSAKRKNSRNLQTGFKWTIITAKFHDTKMTFSRNCLSTSWLYFLTLVHCFAKFIKYFCCLAVSITLILLADIWTMKSCKPSLEKGQNPSIEKLGSIFAKNVNFLQLCRTSAAIIKPLWLGIGIWIIR